MRLNQAYAQAKPLHHFMSIYEHHATHLLENLAYVRLKLCTYRIFNAASKTPAFEQALDLK